MVMLSVDETPTLWVDGTEMKSIGGIDFGNNNLFEVFAPVNKPKDEAFKSNVFPLVLCNHDDPPEDVRSYVLLPDFLKEVIALRPHHLNEIVREIGLLIENYKSQ